MARIKHIAIRTTDPEKTAAFYQEVFGLKKVGLGLNGIFLSDGYINLAILKYCPERERGGGRIGIDISASKWKTLREPWRSLAGMEEHPWASAWTSHPRMLPALSPTTS
jgi:catechol 2,3-dioxygenase-like lactoylglutathione lyase family enzyme